VRRAASLVFLGAVLAGCGAPPPERVPGANVVVIGIDTLRADHLGCYGYRRPTSPRLDALAREAVLFETAVSPSPWTLPAFASIFTGLLPSSHRAGEGKQLNVSRLDPARATLATVLHEAGWRTGSFVSNGYVGRDVGLAEGFDEHREAMQSAGAAAQAIAWLQAHAQERFFVFLHIVDPHQPYAPPAEDAAPFLDPRYTGPVGASFSGFGDPTWSDADRRRVVDLYDGEVHFADGLVGRVLDTLASLGVADRTLVVVVSDHGEELFEHRLIGHGHTLYDELLRVPLIVRWPGGGLHRRVAPQVRAMDVFPTVLDALALPVPDGLDGVSLLPLLHGGRASPETETAFAEYLIVDPERKAIRRDGLKLILDPASGAASLFDLRADPTEQRDVASTRPAETAELRARLEHRLRATLEGFHLLVRGGTAAHRVTAQLRTATRFTDVGLYNPEPEDHYTVSPDGRVLDVDLDVAARAHRPFFGVDVDDDDGVHFRTADGADVEVTLRADGAPATLALGADGAAADGAPPWRFAPGDSRLAVPFPAVPAASADGALRAALVVVHRPVPPLATLDAKTRENLRALGYVD